MFTILTILLSVQKLLSWFRLNLLGDWGDTVAFTIVHLRERSSAETAVLSTATECGIRQVLAGSIFGSATISIKATRFAVPRE